jgi:hypothetical protein
MNGVSEGTELQVEHLSLATTQTVGVPKPVRRAHGGSSLFELWADVRQGDPNQEVLISMATANIDATVSIWIGSSVQAFAAGARW